MRNAKEIQQSRIMRGAGGRQSCEAIRKTVGDGSFVGWLNRPILQKCIILGCNRISLRYICLSVTYFVSAC
jgi:hypothetical protein